ncbi:hypothetical protein [Fontivita pretiosa]|uniref:hypothetical protein n=1 Tax=Fontivita pretiosa TaxID=2989684 RepID=UPI003D1706EB
MALDDGVQFQAHDLSDAIDLDRLAAVGGAEVVGQLGPRSGWNHQTDASGDHSRSSAHALEG